MYIEMVLRRHYEEVGQRLSELVHEPEEEQKKEPAADTED